MTMKSLIDTHKVTIILPKDENLSSLQAVFFSFIGTNGHTSKQTEMFDLSKENSYI